MGVVYSPGVLIALSLLLVGALPISARATKQPHLVYVLADDFGFADADWHRDAGWNEKATPHLSSLITEGIELDQFYAFKFCSPTRSAIQSGRNPIHVNVQNYQPVVYNFEDPTLDTDAGYAGVARNMTGMARMLANGGYATHFVGKWDCGMATHEHTPQGRGYDTSLFYFHHDNDYWTSSTRASDVKALCAGDEEAIVDLFENSGPARGKNNTRACDSGSSAYPTTASGEEMPGCVYEDQTFLDEVLRVVDAHPVTGPAQPPLFLFWAPHIVHSPLQVPKAFEEMYSVVNDTRRRRYLAMVRWLDTAVENVTSAFRKKAMWDDTVRCVANPDCYRYISCDPSLTI